MSSTAELFVEIPAGRSPCCSVRLIASSYSSELSIAFSKIEGFEVTPWRPSSSTSFFKSPFAMKPRARKSSQTACPCSLKRFYGIHRYTFRPICALAASTTFSGVKSNFIRRSLSGAEEPKVFMPTLAPVAPT